ncbi:MAG: PilZ domain-containing protein [Planctomycetota bacterium]
MTVAIPEADPAEGDEGTQESERRDDSTRFQVDAQQLISHVAFRQTKRHAFRVPCNLVDLNAGGAAIQYRLPKALPKSASTTLLEIANLDGDQSMLLLSRVCWSRQIGLDQFQSGLQFRRPIPESMIVNGISIGGLTRREAPRHSMAVVATLRQSEPLLVEETTLICCSETGAQIILGTPLAPGSRLMIQLSDGTGVVGRVAWCSARATEVYSAGIAFIQLPAGRAFLKACQVQAG